MDIKKQIGSRIRSLRRERGLTIEELSFRSGIHYNYIGDIERGVRNPSLESLSRIAAGLGVELKSILDSSCDAGTQVREDSPEYRISRKIILLIRDASPKKRRAILKVLNTLARELS
jgi:transcriptional regulator with XRE-family HTH domain